jgi:hypothetical protein
MNMEQWWNDIFAGETEVLGDNLPSATLSTTNPTWIDPGVNLGLRGERPATNRLSHGTAQTELLKGANSTPKALFGMKHGHINAADKIILVFVIEKHKDVLPITRERIRKKALETITSVKIPQQDCKASNGWAVRFVCRKRLALHLGTTLAQKHHTDYITKLIA